MGACLSAPSSSSSTSEDEQEVSSRSLALRTRALSNRMSRSPALNALRTYATLPDPARSLPATTLLTSNQHCLAIFDRYPKAKYHFLVVPRHPFPPLSAGPESSGQGRADSIVKLEELNDLRSLLLKASRDVRGDVLQAMSNLAEEVVEMVKDEMEKTEGFVWKIDVGFHAVPSMNHLHLHIISEDRISPSLKTKKHHNSFRPDLGFFISLMEVQRWLEGEDGYMRERLKALSGAQQLLDAPLTCFKCDEPFNNVPKLKQHLEREFEREKKQALREIREDGRQRTSEEIF